MGSVYKYFLSPGASAAAAAVIIVLLTAGWLDQPRDLLYCALAVVVALLVTFGADRAQCQQCGAGWG